MVVIKILHKTYSHKNSANCTLMRLIGDPPIPYCWIENGPKLDLMIP